MSKLVRRGNATITRGARTKMVLDQDIHAALKNKITAGIFEQTPIYKTVTIFDYNEVYGLTPYETKYSAGGNTPVIREYVSRYGAVKSGIVQYKNEAGEDTVVSLDDNNYLVPSLLVVKFDFTKAVQPMTKEEADKIITEVKAKGISFSKDGTPQIGGEYKPFVWSPSSERNMSLLMTNIDRQEAWDVLETVGGHRIGEKLSHELDMKKFKKVCARIGITHSPAINFGKIGNDKYGVLFVNAKIEGFDDFVEAERDRLLKANIDVDSETFDGASYMCEEYFEDAARSIGVKMPRGFGRRFAPQMRSNYAYAKVLVDVQSRKVFDVLVDNVTRRYKDAYEVVGNPDNICMILDANGAKMLDDNMKDIIPAEGMDLFLLDVAKASKSKTSGQMAMKTYSIDPERTKARFKELANKNAVEMVENCQGNGNNIPLIDNIDVAKELLFIGKNTSNEALANKIFTDQYLFNRMIKDIDTKATNSVNNCRVDLDSMFHRALFEISSLLTSGKVKNLLGVTKIGAVEVYSPDILEENKDAIDSIYASNMSDEEKTAALDKLLTGFVIKYPTQGSEEVELIRYVANQEIKARLDVHVANNILTEEEADAVYEYFIDTAYGVIKISPQNSLKMKLAGMDTDYDGVVVVRDEVLVDILVQEYIRRNAETGTVNGGLYVYINI